MAPALLFLGVTPNTPADRQNFARALQVLAAEDAHIEVRPGAEPDCTMIGAATEAHLEAIVDRLKREFVVEARAQRCPALRRTRRESATPSRLVSAPAR